MKYSIEICHPNELVTGKWTVVDEMDAMSMDPIESPAFNMYRGLLVRIRGVSTGFTYYAGIYGESSCLSVSQESDIMREIRQETPSTLIFKNLISVNNLFSLYLYATDIHHLYWLLSGLKKQAINVLFGKFSCWAVESTLSYHNENEIRPREAIVAMRRYLDDMSNENWTSAKYYTDLCFTYANSIRDRNSSRCQSAMAAQYLGNSVQDPITYVISSHAVAVTEFGSRNYDEECKRFRADFANEFRARVPFHLIAEALVK